MTPATIRASTGYYTVICDACKGKMFLDGVLCMKCDGDGRLLVQERRVNLKLRDYMRPHFFWLIALSVLAGAVILILM